MDEVLTAVVEAAATPVPSAAPDYSEIITRLDALINLNTSIYAWLALFITLVIGGWCIWQILKPLIYFMR